MKIFLSAVTRELGNCREELTRPLLRKQLEVRVQEHFRPGTATLLEMLRDYIRESDRVILLVGERCGDFPTDDHVKAIGSVAEFDRYRAATGQARASYTQWEFFFAREFGKPIQVFFTGKDFKPDEPNSESADLRACQQAHRDWIQRLGLVRSMLATPEKLIEDVLVDDLATHSGSRPQNLPYHSLGELFKGRDEFIKALHQSLARTSDRRATAIVQSRAVHGLGGVGKTRLAVEYAWQHATDYTALLFVGADSPENLRRNLAALVAPAVLNLPEHDLPHEDVRMAAAVRWLEQHPGWLLILDNVDSPEAAREVQKTLPQFRHGHVLITSRRSQWSATVEPLELDKLALADSADFLLERTAKQRRQTATDRADAESLAGELDGLALALEQAGAYVAQRHCSIAEYLSQWRAHDRAVQEWYDDTVMNYPRSVAATWETTLEQLGPGEVALLRMFAWFAPEPIPLFVLDGEKAVRRWREAAASFSQERGPESKMAGTPHDAMVNLINYGMVKRGEGDEVIIHRVVQEILRNRTPAVSRKDWIKFSTRLLDAAAPAKPSDVRTWPHWNLLRAHVEVCVTAADAEQIAEPTARLMNNLGVLLQAQALYSKAEPFVRRMLAIDEKTFGPEHPNVAIDFNNLAQLLQNTNRLTEAEPLMRRALAIAEKDLGPEHPKIASRLNNLATLLQETNRLTEAEPLMRRALSIDERSFGPEHPNVARDLNNLAMLLKATNRLVEAEPLMRRALAINEKIFGPEHPEVSIELNNLAMLLSATNHPAEAESLMRRALVIDEQNFGLEHPDYAIDLNNLAQLLQATKRPAEAEPLMRKALEIFVKSLGVEHPKSKASARNYVGLLTAKGLSQKQATKAVAEVVAAASRQNG